MMKSERLISVHQGKKPHANISTLELARAMHIEMFPEEYDHKLDNFFDTKARKRGENPKGDEYAKQVNEKRRKQGVRALGSNGVAVADDSYWIAYGEAEQIVTALQAPEKPPVKQLVLRLVK